MRVRGIRLGTTFVLAASALACAGGRPPAGVAEAPVWPPRGADSPGELVWTGAVSDLSAPGVSGVLRAIAGAGEGSEKWTLRRPVSVTLVRAGLLVVDAGASEQVLLCRRDGSAAHRISLPESFQAVAAAATPNGGALIADGPTGMVLAFDPALKRSRRVVEPGTVSRCGGVAAASNGDVLLTDVAGGAVVRVLATGGVIARAGRRGSVPGEFNFPTAILEAPDGTIWVLDALNFRVQHLGPGLEPRGAFGQLGDGSGHFALPKGLAMNDQGLLFVSDARFDNIQVFDQQGRLLFDVGSRGRGPGEFWTPAGLAFGPDGTLAVADSGNQRVQLFQFRTRRGASGE